MSAKSRGVAAAEAAAEAGVVRVRGHLCERSALVAFCWAVVELAGW